MHPPQPGRVPGARRADAGAVRLTERDITGLIVCAEHYGAPTDLLAAALDVRADRLRGIVARWRHVGYAATGTVGPGPAWCWLTPAGMAGTGLSYPASCPALSGLAYIRAVTVREDLMMAAFTRFFTERAFGPGRAAMLAATLPASTTAADQRRQQRAEGLRKKLAKIDVSERALVAELETPIDPADPAAQALRNRVRARFSELYTERTGIETELATLETVPIEQDDPTLLDELPTLGDILTDAPAALTERLLAAFDIQAVYNRDKHQVTIHAALTDATPQAIQDLLTDPRADHNTQPASGPAPQDHVAHLTGDTGSSPRASTASRRSGGCGRRRSAGREGSRPCGRPASRRRRSRTPSGWSAIAGIRRCAVRPRCG